MNTLPRRFFAGFAVALLLSGCAHIKQVSEADALRIADQAAMKAGYRLADFERGRVTGHEGTRWSVDYEGKIPAADRNGLVELKLGYDFLVWVDDRTGKTQIMGGQ